MASASHIAIVGGGPGGLMLARLLQLQGFRPQVFERDAHASDRPQGGSLDLHGDTGQRAMRLAELDKEFNAAARPDDQADRLYDHSGNLLFDRDGLNDNRPEIDRSVLRQILLDSLQPGTVQWGTRIRAITPRTDGRYDVQCGEMTDPFDIVVGADGAWSQVRPLLTDVKPRYEGVTLVEFGFDAQRDLAIGTLVGGGKMFAVGDNRVLIAQRNGHGHVRGYAGLRLTESVAREWTTTNASSVRAMLLEAFLGWSPSLTYLIESGDFIGVRPLYALPIGYRWASRRGVTLLGDAAHLMSPFAGEGVNLALADAVDLADVLVSVKTWSQVTACEAALMERARPAAEGAAAGLDAALSSAGATAVLHHYRARGATQAGDAHGNLV